MTDTIRRPIEQELTDYSRAYRSTLSSPNSLLHAALQHIGQRAGKIMRPTLLLLCAREAGRVTPAAIHAAVGLELLHTASLVHDDVVDESDRRRGQASVNALFDNKAAVLVGDYLTSAALSQIVRTGCAEAVERTAWLGQQLADGELLQLHATDATTFSIDTYYEVIAKKTAALFATCARLGARLGGADDRQVEAMERLGHLVGLCFQLRDDLFDLDTQHDVGKPAANDLREGKLSLPYLYPLTRHEAPCTVSAVHPAPSAPTPCTPFQPRRQRPPHRPTPRWHCACVVARPPLPISRLSSAWPVSRAVWPIPSRRCSGSPPRHAPYLPHSATPTWPPRSVHTSTMPSVAPTESNRAHRCLNRVGSYILQFTSSP